MSLRTPNKSVQKLPAALQMKAKANANYRFYSLWDKIYRKDVLAEAYRRCRANGGAPGVDGVTFDAIEAQGVDAWLASLQEELRHKSYRAQPLLRVWIPSVSTRKRRESGTGKQPRNGHRNSIRFCAAGVSTSTKVRCDRPTSLFAGTPNGVSAGG